MGHEQRKERQTEVVNWRLRRWCHHEVLASMITVHSGEIGSGLLERDSLHLTSLGRKIFSDLLDQTLN